VASRELRGAVVAVVGATGGLGREISVVLAERGAAVVRVGRNQPADLQIDVRDSNAGDELVAYCTDRFGRLDGVIVAAPV
jgi:cyclic-di-GMP-binding biofilm dispersal mediator protein